MCQGALRYVLEPGGASQIYFGSGKVTSENPSLSQSSYLTLYKELQMLNILSSIFKNLGAKQTKIANWINS